MNKQIDFYLKWTATAILILGTAVNGLGYYPLGPLLLVLGGAIWLAVAIRVRDTPLIVTNLVMSLVGLAAVVFTMMNLDTPPEGSVKADEYVESMRTK
jgi:hypothetical protein